MNRDPIADLRSGVNHHARVNPAELSDPDVLADHSAGFNVRSRANLRVVSDHCRWANGNALSKFDVGAEDGAGVDARRRRKRLKQLGCESKPKAGMIGLDNASIGRVRSGASGRKHNGSGKTVQRLLRRIRVFGEDQFGGTGKLAGAYAIHFLLRISLHQLSAERFNQLFQRHARLPFF